MVNKEIKLVTNLHLKTKRKYLERMMDNKIKCMIEAKKYEKNYWDGDRKFGYGGYKYIPGRWEGVAKKLIKKFKLNSSSKILDVGCGKAFLLYEIKKIIPNIKIIGFDVSKYAIKSAPKILKKNIFIHKAEEKYPYEKNYFDLVISLGCLHNLSIFNLEKALNEISRVGKDKYIMVESYKNNKQLFNLQCWALTCNSFFSKKEWQWVFQKFGYNGFYEFIYFD
tara:strand:+ start:81 stop:749 length:669 start_codon:yes stop_codon:yes gene_type:complete